MTEQPVVTQLENPVAKMDAEALKRNVSEGLKKVAEVNEKINSFVEESALINIQNEDDKEGFVKTKLFLSKVRPLRTGLEAERKSVVKPFADLVANINAAYKGCTEKLSAIEAPHKEQKEQYENAEQQRKDAELLEKENAINVKVQRLLEAGLNYNPQNGFYENDRGITVSRMDITNMEEEVLASVEFRASTRKDEILKEAQQEKERIEEIENRKRQLLSLGMSTGLTGYFIIENETDNKHLISFDDLNYWSDFDFDKELDRFSSIIAQNENFRKKQIEESQKLKKDQEKIKKDSEEFNRKKIAFYQNALEAEDFNFQYRDPFTTSFFLFNLYGKRLSVTVDELLLTDSSVDEIIMQARDIKEEHQKQINAAAIAERTNNRIALLKSMGIDDLTLDNFNLSDEDFSILIQKEKKRIEDENKILLEQKEQDRKDKEAELKEEAKEELVCLKKDLHALSELISKLLNEKYKILKPYTNTFSQELENSLAVFLDSLSHLK